jgi:hypothetical protein
MKYLFGKLIYNRFDTLVFMMAGGLIAEEFYGSAIILVVVGVIFSGFIQYVVNK